MAKIGLEDFIKNKSVNNAYIQYKNLKSYYRKGPLNINGVFYKNILTRANTSNTKRLNNVEPNTKAKSTGQYRELDRLTEELAKKYGFEGIYIESVLNGFLHDKLLQYGYTMVNKNYGTDNYFKPIKPDKEKISAKRGGDPKRAQMLKTVMPLISGDRGKRFAKAVNAGDVDQTKAMWLAMGDDLYQIVEQIRDENISEQRKEKHAIKAFNPPQVFRGGDDGQPDPIVKNYIATWFHLFRGYVELEFSERHPVKYKKSYQEAYYFSTTIIVNGDKHLLEIEAAINFLKRVNRHPAQNITLVGIPEVLEKKSSYQYILHFCYYKDKIR